MSENILENRITLGIGKENNRQRIQIFYALQKG